MFEAFGRRTSDGIIGWFGQRLGGRTQDREA
jgi:hypothetical protein